MAQGQWSQEDLADNINCLELRAGCLTLREFQDKITDHHILILSDNVATKGHINRQGGMHSRALMQEAELLGLWAEKHLLSIRAEHIWEQLMSRQTAHGVAPASGTVQRNNRTVQDSGPGPVHHTIRQPAAIFYSRFGTLRVEGANALCTPWLRGLLYAFPPLPMIPRVIRKVLEEKAEVLFLAPHWPRQPWFADLVSLSVSSPCRILQEKIFLSQGALVHPEPQ